MFDKPLVRHIVEMSLFCVVLTHPLPEPFPFYDHEQALKLMLDVARSNFQGRKSLDHKNHNFLLIPGGIGIGKTRMGWKSKYLSSNLVGENDDNDEFVEAMKNPCYNFIDLNNGSKYIDGFDDKEDASVRIGARIALSSGLVSDSRLSTLVMDTNIGLFSLSNVICEILKHHFIKNWCPLAIIIHLDEYQVYINDIQQHQQLSWKNSRDFFKSMLKAIGSVMHGNNIEREYNGKYFIIPICTGTSAIDIHFLPTEHKQEILELRPLNYVSAKSMFLDKYYYSSGIANKDDVFIDDFLGQSTLKSDFDWGNQLLTKISGQNIELNLEKKQEEIYEICKINRKIDLKKQELNNQINNNWQLSDIFRGVKGADTLLQCRVQLRQLKVFVEKEKFLQLTDDIAKFDKSVLCDVCDDNVICPFNGGVFRCYQGCANIDHHWTFDSANSGKNLAIFSQIKYSERDSTTELSTPAIKRCPKKISKASDTAYSIEFTKKALDSNSEEYQSFRKSVRKVLGIIVAKG
ncbi:hypothetical protein RhiirA4_524867 [Rhizophagus irregularis]|uniref:Uncharacterized protein n=1 Tax=Rhizophagus irregularis TaxID=588596 RepID=A0A2I1GNT9_9GLOM|nr:hypothetical protein RhiirA4_524867 [Rhizophagus irregularis]